MTIFPSMIQGMGQSLIRSIAAFPAIANAILDALASIGVRGFDGPASPARIWQAMEVAR